MFLNTFVVVVRRSLESWWLQPTIRRAYADHLTLTASAVSICVSDRLAAAYRLAQSQLNLRRDSLAPVQHVGSWTYGSAFCLRAGTRHSAPGRGKREP